MLLALFLTAGVALECVTRELKIIEHAFRQARTPPTAAAQLQAALEQRLMRHNHRELAAAARKLCAEVGARYDDPCVYGAYDARTDECVVSTDRTLDCVARRRHLIFADCERRFPAVERRVRLCNEE